MFTGQFKYSVDAKGRISIPAKLRRQFSPEAGNRVMMNRGTVDCIEIYPMDQWQIIENRIKELNPFDRDVARFKRKILQFCNEDELDGQSRIMITQDLLKIAKIEKEVLILGSINKIELWNPEEFEKYLGESDENFEQLAAKVMAL